MEPVGHRLRAKKERGKKWRLPWAAWADFQDGTNGMNVARRRTAPRGSRKAKTGAEKERRTGPMAWASKVWAQVGAWARERAAEAAIFDD